MNNQSAVIPKNDICAVSPDGRYLVVGKQNIRVWDLKGLQPDVRYTAPIHRQTTSHHPITALRFIDNDRIEVTDIHGTLQYWDISSGTEVVAQ